MVISTHLRMLISRADCSASAGVSVDYNAKIPIVGTCIRAFQNIYVPRSALQGKTAQAATVHGKSVTQAIADR